MSDCPKDYLLKASRVDRWWMLMLYMLAILHVAGSVNPAIALLIAVITLGCGIGWFGSIGPNHHPTLGRYALSTAFVFIITTIDNYNLGLLLFK